MKIPDSLFTDHQSLITVCVLFVSAANLFAQGSLTPPGAPTPTMKTLQQIEPRIDLQNAPASTVTTNDAGYHFIINQPGSYYLSASLGVTRPNGIQINTAGVTLDLNGFEISRTSGVGGNGIEIPATSHRANVRGGSITGFSQGVVCVFNSTYARNGSFTNLSVSNCTSFGILSGLNWVLDHCVAYDCAGTAAIDAGNGNTVVDCLAYNNTANNALFANSGSTLTRCNAYKNNVASYAISASDSCTLNACNASENNAVDGIHANFSSLLNCTANYNTRANGGNQGIEAYRSILIGCEASNNTNASTTSYFSGAGIKAAYSSIIHCIATSNLGDGIQIDFDSYVLENQCYANGSGTGDGAGIHVTGGRNRIEGNNVTQNDRGIEIGGVGNLILRNSARGNPSNNYTIIGSNRYGPIVDLTAGGTAAAAGDSASSTVNTADPWANFSY